MKLIDRLLYKATKGTNGQIVFICDSKDEADSLCDEYRQSHPYFTGDFLCLIDDMWIDDD